MERPPAKVIVNSKYDWVRILGIIAICLLLFSVLIIRNVAWAIIVVILVGAGFVALRDRFIEPLFWERPEVHFYSWPLTLGSQTSVDYVRRRRRGSASEGPVEGWVAVTCTEEATYSIGTNTYTDKATAFVDRFDVHGQKTSDEVRIPLVVSIPVHAGAPTMSKPNNEIRWDLATRLSGVTSRNSDASFRLSVAAVLTDQADRAGGSSI